MSLVTRDAIDPSPARSVPAAVAHRDVAIDTMRGVAILMVVGIHSFRQPLGSWETLTDAALRPCVPIFLFASGYLTALSGRVPLVRRLKTAIVPYAIAFVPAYVYMALHNPAMDHRLSTTVARFVLAYVFVYYYVFVYLGCTIALWLAFSAAGNAAGPSGRVVAFLLAILFALIAGSYLDPLASRLGLPEALTEELRMRDIPFWFSFMALGALVGLTDMRYRLAATPALMFGAALLAYSIYAAVRLFRLGDAADYDSIAFFGYAALLCLTLFLLDARVPFLASCGSGSYFIYLWHIFIVMALRDHASLDRLGSVASFAITYVVTAFGSILALLAVRANVPPRLSRWLGA
ncbi:MAG TPA: acyltransferase [Bradyrhizobium sp.]|uniref:acyltransferase n=1 Tax=Bradyrhizobium sp. TaxID=376 RepID=UPI002CAD33CA|nr:acyltransferase [Bradyrhizobium sp.]HLZ01625.1 acyltransferase [Bradyrhizobium sp.]